MSSEKRVLASGMAFVALAAQIALIGCMGPEREVVGEWKDSLGKIMTFNADMTFSKGTGARELFGHWSIRDKTVTLRVEKIGGNSADDVIAHGAVTSKLPAADLAKLQAQIKALEYKLSEDGKTLTFATLNFIGTGRGILTKVEPKN
jgi:hypothetical protein